MTPVHETTVDPVQSRHGLPPDPREHPDLYEGVLWRRSIAYLFDLLVLTLLGGITWLVLGMIGILSFGLLLPLQALAVAILPLAYHSYFLGRHGATPGMQIFDIEIRTTAGTGPDYLRAFAMTVLFYLSIGLTSWLILLVGLFNPRHRLLHDFLSGTVGLRHRSLAPVRARPA